MIINPYAFASSGGATDPFFADVVSLLHFEGANGSTTFTDQKGLVYTPVGSATISTTQAKFGSASGSFPTGSNRLTAPAITGGLAGDFTFECFIYPTTVSATQGLFRFDTSNRAIYINGGKLKWYNGSTFSGANTAVINTWQHFAICRASGTLSMYLNGVKDATTFTDTTNLNTTYSVGGDAFGQALTGFMDEFRITGGVARYSANFTPPTAAFPNS